MDQQRATVATRSYPRAEASLLATHKVLRNTYMLLAATLLFSAATAGIAMAINMPYLGPWITLGVYFGLLFAVHKTRNSGWGLVFVFALTGFLGLSLGPLLNYYLAANANARSTS